MIEMTPISCGDILDKLPQPFYIINAQLKVVFANKYALNFFEKTNEDLPFSLIPFLLPEQKIRARQALEIVYSQESWMGEIAYTVGSEKKEHLFESFWYQVKDRSSEITIAVTNTDISEKRSLQKQLLRMQRVDSMGSLSSGIIHDLNNVFSMFLMATKVLKKTADDTKRDLVLQMLEKGVKRGIGMMGQMLSFVKGEEGETVEVKLKPIILELKNLMSQTMTDKIDFDVQIEKNIFNVWGNPVQLHQVILNLCTNAKDALESVGGGVLRVIVENKVVEEAGELDAADILIGNYVKIQIIDTGAGMEEDTIAKIFEPFYSTKQEAGKGTGLGLSTVQFIVKAHQGHIFVNSVPGQGTIFTIYLPAR